MEAEQSKAAIEAMGLSTSPAADAMGLRTTEWSSPLGQMLSGEGPGTLKYALRSMTADTSGGDASSSAQKGKQAPARATPIRPFVKVFFESLRDNLAKAAAAGLVAIVAAVLARIFGVF